MTLMLHSGTESATMNELISIPLPQKTRTYQPVPHEQLSTMLLQMVASIFPDFSYEKSHFGLAAEGNKMFGIHTFRSVDSALGLSIGFRNSYDRSMSVGIAVGASVFVCDNMVISGDITVLRKHTSNVIRDMESMALQAIYRSQSTYREILDDAGAMQDLPLNDDQAYRMLGLVYGRGIMTPRQIPIAHREWESPTHDDFTPRTVWSLYNAITEALKSAPLSSIMEKHLALHHLFADQFRWKEA